MTHLQPQPEPSSLSGHDLIAAGARPGPWFAPALAAGNEALAKGASREEAFALALSREPAILDLNPLGGAPMHVHLTPESAEERENLAAVEASMAELLRTPMTKAGALMPDACPTGGRGVIPVGGIALSEAIHPGMHSADICCSVMITIMRGVGPAALLDAIHAVTHFGPGGRAPDSQLRPPDALLARFLANPLLDDLIGAAVAHFGTQGDGNHFAYVGQMRSTGETALVTHHGSRAPGAKLYAKGMKIAEAHRQRVSPQTLEANAWIPPDTREADQYWEALQVLRLWTKANHEVLHDLAMERCGAKQVTRFWNEHNFVFRRSDGLFAHGKGATPAFQGWAEDATELTLIPLNMGAPILVTRGLDSTTGLGFAPHGAGRNFSRAQHRRLQGGRPVAEIFAEETKGLDARFFSGRVDVSELPSAYKNAAAMRRQIEEFGLAEIVDEVIPYGCLMAGEGLPKPWARKPRASEGGEAAAS